MNYRHDPIIIGAVGGSGTRVISKILRQANIYMSGIVDAQEDAQVFSQFYNRYARDYIGGGFSFESAEHKEASGELVRCVEEHLSAAHNPDFAWGAKNPRSILMLSF